MRTRQVFSSSLFILAVVFILSTLACQGKKVSDSSKYISALKRVHFDFDSASLRPDMVTVLDRNSKYLKKNKDLNVVIEGHCDERGTNEYNLALGDRRATAVQSYLVHTGLNAKRLDTVSYGEERPLTQEHDESSWYINRRADFVHP